MPKFNVEYTTLKAPSETWDKVKAFFGNPAEIQKFDANAKCTFNDEKKTCLINGSQFKADLVMTPNAEGSKVIVTVDLPLLLSPFKGKIQETLQRMLTKHLG